MNGLEESEKSVEAVVEFEDEPITKDIIKLGFLQKGLEAYERF